MKNKYGVLIINFISLIASIVLLYFDYDIIGFILIAFTLIIDILIYMSDLSIRYNNIGKHKSIIYAVIDNQDIYALYYGKNKTRSIINKVYKIIKNEINSKSIVKKYRDHFIIIVNSTNRNELVSLVTRINNKAENIIKDDLFSISISCGIQVCDKEDYNTNENRASIACNMAKNEKINYYSFYDNEDVETQLKEKKILYNLVKALKNNEFEVYYQPKYDFKEKKIVGSEALSRLRQNGEIVPAKEFIDIAEKYGFTTYLDKYVLKEVCKRINELKKDNVKFDVISVNVSRNTLSQKQMIEYYEAVLKRYNIKKSEIEFEVTERNENGYVSLVDKIHELSKKFNISIDDFGIGSSSLSMLMERNIKTVKIDRQFIVDKSENGRKLLNNIIKLVKELGFNIVAEGVETLEQQEYLKSKGCNVIQGYYFSKPLTFNEYKEILRSEIDGS